MEIEGKSKLPDREQLIEALRTPRERLIESLRWQKQLVLDDGFVALVDVMGSDRSVIDAARVSYGKDDRDDRHSHDLYLTGDYDAPSQILDSNGHVVLSMCKKCGLAEAELEDAPTCSRPGNRALLRYLMRHRHTTPFEMVELKFLVRVPMDCWRQWIRHRMASVNEYSTRYTEAIDSQQETDPSEWRLQSGLNKQGSDGFLPGANDGPGAVLSREERRFHEESRRVYKNRLAKGVAREQARKDLPLSTYTEAYWKIDLHNLLHFLGLRMDSHAQKEIRDYATTIGEKIVAPLFPMVWEAFLDYRMNAMYLTALDIETIRNLLAVAREFPIPEPEETPASNDFEGPVWPDQWRGLRKCRERDECIAKMRRLGLIQE